MPHRRTLLLALVATPLLPAGRAIAADPEQAAAFVDSMLKEVVAIMSGGGPLASKQAAMQRVLEQRADIDAVARFCLGRFWRSATPQQQQEYATLFRRVLSNNITSRLGEYQGFTYTMGRPMKREEDIAVATTVLRPGNAPNKVDWVVTADGAPKVIDVIAEGTSLRLTQRSDYSAFITRNGNSVQALIDALRRQAAGA